MKILRSLGSSVLPQMSEEEVATLTGFEPVISRLEGGSLIQFGHRASGSVGISPAARWSEKSCGRGGGIRTHGPPSDGRSLSRRLR